MSKLGVRNIDGFNARVAEAARAGRGACRASVQTGFDKHSGEPIYEEEEIDLSSRCRIIVVIVDEMADLMMVAGKEIEGARSSASRRWPAPPASTSCTATQRPVGRRHHRHDQGELPDPHLLPGHQSKIDSAHHPRRDGRRAAARPGRHALHGRRRPHHSASTGRSSRDARGREAIVAHLKTQGAAGLSRPDHHRATRLPEAERRRWRRLRQDRAWPVGERRPL
jgi:S-DNA-T family DNA segregation ATPase FtsK/SpoIIIE